MIVISGALVLVAFALLIAGIAGPELTFVYGSILVSLVSFVFLVIGIRQRRGDRSDVPEQVGSPALATVGASGGQPAAAAPRGGGSVAVVDDSPPADTTRQLSTAGSAPVEEDDDYDDDYDDYDDEEIDPADDRAVLVVEGRPRYHALGCRYLTGKPAETIHLLDAREEGFTPCGVCKPDNVIAVEDDIAVVPAEEGVEAIVDVYDPDEGAEEEAPEPEPAAVAASAPPAPAKRAGSTRVQAPSAAAAAPAESAPAGAAAGRRTGSVVVIPDRGKYHRPECRYVRGAAGAEVRTKTQATKQGFTACGVCKP